MCQVTLDFSWRFMLVMFINISLTTTAGEKMHAFGVVPSLVGLEGLNAVISQGAENHMPGISLLLL